jgi:hypothetical protein
MYTRDSPSYEQRANSPLRRSYGKGPELSHMQSFRRDESQISMDGMSYQLTNINEKMQEVERKCAELNAASRKRE